MKRASASVVALVLSAGALAPGAIAQDAAPAAAATNAVTIELRGSPATLAGELVSIDAAGVKIKSGERTQWVAWDVVRVVKGVSGYEKWNGLSESAYRARARVDRGDYIRAEQELQKLSEQLSGTGVREGPTPAMVAEGLIRVRLARGYRLGAVFAWLNWNDSAADASSVGGRYRGSPLIDRATGLCVALPPVFSARLDGEALRASLDAPEWNGNESILAKIYRAAASFEAIGSLPAGFDASEIEQGAMGTSIVGEVVLARVGDDAQRKAARARLGKRLDAVVRTPVEPKTQPTDVDAALPAMMDEPGDASERRWVEAWCHVGMGRSLLREAELAQRRAGVLELLHIPARFGDLMPALAAIALSEAADELDAQGDKLGAERLRDDLASRFVAMNVPRLPVTINGWTLVRGGADKSGERE